MNIEISIIIPVYNVSKYIQDCLLSIQNQTFKNFEVIIVNDGSTDSSGRICDEFAKQDNKFKVFHKRNGGVNTARKFGIEKALGKYLFFCDGDDLLTPDALENLYKKTENEKLDICVGGQYIWAQNQPFPDISNIKYDIEEKFQKVFEAKDLDYFNMYENIWFMIFPGKLIKKQLFKNQYIATRLKYGEDQICLKEILFKAKRICVLPQYIYIYRKRPNSATTKRNKRAFDIFESHDILEKVLTDYGVIEQEYSNLINWSIKCYIIHMKFYSPYSLAFKFIEKVFEYIACLDLDKLDNSKITKCNQRLIKRASDLHNTFYWKIYYIAKILFRKI